MAQIQKYLGFGCKALVFCRNDGWLLENMDKGHKLSKWVLTNRPKIPWVTQKISAQFVCLSQRVWDFWKKNSLWVSVVRTWAAFQAENARCCAVQHLRHHNLSYCHVSSTPDSEARKVSKVTYVQLNKYQTDIYIFLN